LSAADLSQRVLFGVFGLILFGAAVGWAFIGFFGAPCDASAECNDGAVTAAMVLAAVSVLAFATAGAMMFVTALTGSQRLTTPALQLTALAFIASAAELIALAAS
jgi:hypothetical protein